MWDQARDEGKGEQNWKQSSSKGAWQVFSGSRWPGKGLVRRSCQQVPDEPGGTDRPPGASAWASGGEQLARQQVPGGQRRVQVLSFPYLSALPFQAKRMKAD